MITMLALGTMLNDDAVDVLFIYVFLTTLSVAQTKSQMINE
jgi:hypothetical protein